MEADCYSTEDDFKKEASSIQGAHIRSLLSKIKIRPQSSLEHVEQIETCLHELDSIPEISTILKALQFSDQVLTIVLDMESDDMTCLGCPDSLGWYHPDKGHIFLGAKKISSDRCCFVGVLAHELSHWGMRTVFENQCLPYFDWDPDGEVEGEFGRILKNVQDCQRENDNLPDEIYNVFRNYPRYHWDQELIVRVPHLMASVGTSMTNEILSSQESTRQLLDFFRTRVMPAFDELICDSHLLESRKTVSNFNKELGLLKIYTRHQFRFTSLPDSLPTSGLLVLTSPHPMLSFMKYAWALNCRERNSKFSGNHIFADFDNFQSYYWEVLPAFRDIDDCKVLYIVCQNLVDERSVVSIWNLILKECLSNSKKSVVFFMKYSVFASLQRGSKVNGNIKHIGIDWMQWKDLDETSKERVLEFSVDFQGTKKKLREILDQEEYRLVDGVLIERFLKNETVSVGNRITSSFDLPPGFVTIDESMMSDGLVELVRTFQRDKKRLVVLIGGVEQLSETMQTQLSKAIGYDIKDCILTHVDLEEVTSPVLIYSLKSDGDYIWLAMKLAGTAMFELIYFISLKSNGVMTAKMLYSPDLSLNRILKSEISTVNQDSFLNRIAIGDGSVFVLSDVAGTGKSQFLNLIWAKLRNQWVIKLSLREMSPFLDDYFECQDTDDVIKLICEAGKIDDDFAQKLLDSRIKNRHKTGLLLLLDGLDEVTASDRSDAASNKNKIGSMVRCLENRFVTTLITTRPDSETILKHNLNAQFFHFGPLGIAESRLHLTRMCIQTGSLFPACLQEAAVIQRVNEYLEICQLTDEFFDNPLHLKMMAEVIRDMTRNDNLPSVPRKDVSMNYLYTEFIGIKYKLYFKEKYNGRFDLRIKDSSDSMFKDVALYYLFGHEGFVRQYLIKSSWFDSKNGTLSLKYEKVAPYSDIGVISCSDSPSLGLRFIHHTFADYFVSRLFIEWSSDQDRSAVLLRDVLQCQLRFFDLMLPHVELSRETWIFHGMTIASFGEDGLLAWMKQIFNNYFASQATIDFILRCLAAADKKHLITKNSRILKVAVEEAHSEVIRRLLQEDWEFGLVIDHLPTLFYGLKMNLVKEVASKYEGVELSEFFEELGKKPLILKIRGSQPVNHFTMMSVALRNGRLDIAKWLMSRGICLDYLTALNDAVDSGNCATVEWVLQEGCDVNAVNGFGETALHLAAEKGDLDMVKYLCSVGANLEARTRDGSTALHLALQHSTLSCVQWLVERADVSAVDFGGAGCLHRAVSRRGAHAVTPLLIAKGCDVCWRDRRGWTAAHSLYFLMNFFVEPDSAGVLTSFKLLVTEMRKRNMDILTELIPFAEAIGRRTPGIQSEALSWMKNLL